MSILPDAARRSDLTHWLTHKVRPMFKWRLLVEEGRKTGHTFSQPDQIIAATAQHHGLTVVSRDTSEFVKARVPVVNPWVDVSP